MRPNRSLFSYWSRKFKKHMETKRASRISIIPQLIIPHILVDNESRNSISQDSHRRTSEQPRWTHLSAGDGASAYDAPSTADLTLHDTRYHHPLSDPQSSQLPTSPQGRTSGLSFELHEPEALSQLGSQPSSRDSSRPVEVQEMLDDSIWVESIRRSATSRRHNAGSYRFGDLG